MYRVATNTCLSLVRTASRRPTTTGPLPGPAPAPTDSTEVRLKPYPDALLDQLPDGAPGPDARVEQDEAVSLAFVTALQLLSPRARGVLILRDVLGFSAGEVAGILDSTEQAVAMALSRARASLGELPTVAPTGARPREQTTLVRRLAAALKAHDVDTMVTLLADDVRIAMPPLPAVWEGSRRAVRSLTEVAFRLVPDALFLETHANRQPALAVYARDDPNGLWRASGLLVITCRDDRVAGLTRFESPILRHCGLPRVLTDAARQTEADGTGPRN